MNDRTPVHFPDPRSLKDAVRAFWDANPCGADVTSAPRYTRAYYDEIEAARYALEPEIPAFAGFEGSAGKRVLEVGVGAGTDFIQWVRAGAEAHGVDLTPEAVTHVRRRLEVYGIGPADVRVADCEALPYPDSHFDIVYSWGVIHHTPDTARALREIVRVLRPGGRGRIMVYHRRSLFAGLLWLRKALLAGRPWRSLAWCIWDLESPGTKAFTRAEVRAMLAGLPVADPGIRTHMTWSDRLASSGPVARALARVLAALLGDRFGWFLTLELIRTGDQLPEVVP